MKISRKLISAVMTRTVCRVGVEQSASQALKLMQAQSVSSVLVIEDELLLGIITERDIVRALSRSGDLRSLSCVDLMQSPVVTVPGTTFRFFTSSSMVPGFPVTRSAGALSILCSSAAPSSCITVT